MHMADVAFKLAPILLLPVAIAAVRPDGEAESQAVCSMVACGTQQGEPAKVAHHADEVILVAATKEQIAAPVESARPLSPALVKEHLASLSRDRARQILHASAHQIDADQSGRSLQSQHTRAQI